MERDCGAWINLLSHKVKKRLNATLADLGITGVQSRIMHYIVVHCENGPVFQRDVWPESLDRHRHFAAFGEKRRNFAGKRRDRRPFEEPCSDGQGGANGRAGAHQHTRD